MSDAFLAQIVMFGGNFAPRGWAFCEGQLLAITQNAALFAVLGTTFGGNGQTTFALPDLRGRVPIHPGQGPGLSPHSLGEQAGQENHTLSTNQIPAHTHTATANCVGGSGNSNVPTGRVWSKDAGVQSATYSNSAPNAAMASNAVSIASAGGSQPHNNMQPYTCVNFIICLQGFFPSQS